MKKLTMAAMAILFCFSGAASAQSARRTSSMSSTHHETFFVSTELEFGMPIGNYSDVNGVGGGVMLVGEYPLLDALSATARIGFQYHANKAVSPTVDVHVHSIPILLGAKYYLMPDRQGLFGAFELGLFDLMTDVGGTSQNDLKFGTGIGVGYAMKQWNARVNLHAQDVGHFGDLLMITAGVGYQFAGF
jgi:hypothetical protein